MTAGRAVSARCAAARCAAARRAAAALWLAVLGAAAACRGSEPPADPLRGATARVVPGTDYYVVLQGSDTVGAAWSAIEPEGNGMRVTDAFRGRLLILGDSQTVDGAARARLMPDFRVDSFSFSVGGETVPLRVRGAQTSGGRLLVPQLVPMALMLSGAPAVGRSGTYWVFNPVARDVQQITVRITAESVLTVPGRVRADTVRAWALSTVDGGGVTAWADRDGRVVAASEPGGMHLERAPRAIARGVMRRYALPPTQP